MQTKFIKTEDYLLLIDEEAEMKHCNPINICHAHKSKPCDKCHRIGGILVLAYYPLSKEAKELEKLPLLPNPFENSFDITKWAKEEHKYNHRSIHELSFVLGCEVGYKAAQSKQFSLEDMKNHIQDFLDFCSQNYSYDSTFGWYENGNLGHRPNTSTLIENYIQSLPTQQLPVGFEPKFDRIRLPKGDDGWEDVYQLRITINPQGQKVVQGEYKFE